MFNKSLKALKQKTSHMDGEVNKNQTVKRKCLNLGLKHHYIVLCLLRDLIAARQITSCGQLRKNWKFIFSNETRWVWALLGEELVLFSAVLSILLFASARTAVLIKAALGVSSCEGLREGYFHWSHVVGLGPTVGVFADYTIHFI